MMKSILLIEDDTWLGASFVALLEKEFTVEHVTTLEKAILSIDCQPPDAIVADFMLGSNNALVLFHELSSYQDTVNIPVVLCSTIGEDLALYEKQLAHYGVVKICDKASITPDSLRRAVREAIVVRGKQ